MTVFITLIIKAGCSLAHYTAYSLFLLSFWFHALISLFIIICFPIHKRHSSVSTHRPLSVPCFCCCIQNFLYPSNYWSSSLPASELQQLGTLFWVISCRPFFESVRIIYCFMLLSFITILLTHCL